MPSVGSKPRLNVYGILEIGDVPSLAFVMKLTPNELINNPMVNSKYLFNTSCLLTKVPPYKSYCYIFYIIL